jgi:hypothetical protein
LKKFTLACLLIGGTTLQAHASDCTAAYQDILYKQATYQLAKPKVVGIGPAPLGLIQDHLNKATGFLASYIGTQNDEYRRVDVARAMLRVQDPSQVQVIILEWTGTVHRPTNIRIRGYEGIIVNKNDCKPISASFSYDNNSIGEGSGLPREAPRTRA